MKRSIFARKKNIFFNLMKVFKNLLNIKIVLLNKAFRTFVVKNMILFNVYFF